jgi:hypothetical protein
MQLPLLGAAEGYTGNPMHRSSTAFALSIQHCFMLADHPICDLHGLLSASQVNRLCLQISD